MDAETKQLVRCLVVIFALAVILISGMRKPAAQPPAHVVAECICDLECEWVQKKIREEQKQETKP